MVNKFCKGSRKEFFENLLKLRIKQHCLCKKEMSYYPGGMNNDLMVKLKRIPKEGMHFESQLAESWFDDEQWAQIGNAHYALHIVPSDELYIVTGTFSGELSHPCVKCLEDLKFKFALNVHYHVIEGEEPPDNDGLPTELFSAESYYCRENLDLQALLWEHLLLELPTYPSCDHPLALPTQLCSFKKLLDD